MIGARWILIVGLVLLCGALATAYDYRTGQYIETKNEYDALQTKWAAVQLELENERKAHKALRLKRTTTQTKFVEVKTDLAQYKGKGAELTKKLPEVTIRVQASFDDYVKSMQCVTGEVSTCK